MKKDFDLSTYHGRLQWAMNEAGIKVTRLAADLGASYQGVKKVVDGVASNGFQTANHLTACRILGILPDWLMFGEGPARRDGSTPVSATPGSRAHQLPVRSSVEPELSGMAVELGQLYDMVPGRLERSAAFSECSAILLEKIKKASAPPVKAG
jgi:hypothetical protein